MNKQEIFDKVYLGLQSQGFEKSTSGEGNKFTDPCYYRWGHLKCAAGHLVPDEEYNSDWDDRSKGDGTVDQIDWFKQNFEEELFFIALLQSDHDYSKSPDEMKSLLINRAKNYNLKVPE